VTSATAPANAIAVSVLSWGTSPSSRSVDALIDADASAVETMLTESPAWM